MALTLICAGPRVRLTYIHKNMAINRTSSSRRIGPKSFILLTLISSWVEDHGKMIQFKPFRSTWDYTNTVRKLLSLILKRGLLEFCQKCNSKDRPMEWSRSATLSIVAQVLMAVGTSSILVKGLILILKLGKEMFQTCNKSSFQCQYRKSKRDGYTVLEAPPLTFM